MSHTMTRSQPSISHARTVPRDLVHRASVHEVLLTDSRVCDGSSAQFLVGVQWPRHHSITGASPVIELDDILVIETVRQIGIYLTLQYLDPPASARFIAQSLNFAWIDSPPQFGYAPINAIAYAVLTEKLSGRGPRGGLQLDVSFQVAGTTVASGRGDLRCVGEALYERLRGSEIADATTNMGENSANHTEFPGASQVGRQHSGQVVVVNPALDADSRTITARLRIDLGHPCFFDHPQDHLPANLFAEASRQTALLLVGQPTARVRSLSATFQRFANLTDPVDIYATEDISGHITVKFQQSDNTVATSELAVATRARQRQGHRPSGLGECDYKGGWPPANRADEVPG